MANKNTKECVQESIKELQKEIDELTEEIILYTGTPKRPPQKKRNQKEIDELWNRVNDVKNKIDNIKNIVQTEKIFLSLSKLSKNAVELFNNGSKELMIDCHRNLTVRLDIGAYDEVKVPDSYTGYMDVIQMTIGSLMDCGAQVVTAEQIYRTMNGLTKDDKVTPQAVGAVTKAMMQLRNLWVTIDRTDEVKKYKKLNNVDSIIHEKALFPCSESLTITNKAGRKMTAYKVDSFPPLYEYSKDRGELRSLPGTLLNIKGLNSSKQNLAIKIWLLRQIESMKPGKNGKHRTNVIKINTLFEALKFDLTFSKVNPRADRAKYIKQIKKMLDYWTECGYIKGYKETHSKGRGKALESLIILLPD